MWNALSVPSFQKMMGFPSLEFMKSTHPWISQDDEYI
jgi:hypothetical protein